MGTVRSLRMGIWRGVARITWPKLLVILALNVIIVGLVWPAEEELDLSHLEQHSAYD